MTEVEWTAAQELLPMLTWVEDTTRPSDRKFRLFACACCRSIWRMLPDLSRQAVVVAERHADDEATEQDCKRASIAAFSEYPVPNDEYGNSAALAASNASSTGGSLSHAAASAAASACAAVANRSSPVAEDRIWDILYFNEEQRQIALIRDIFGNPFRPVGRNPAWLTLTVVSLARRMYEARDFSPMPILADALQDAGCDNADVLDHCRGDGPHVLGCHVVDLILGKE